MAVQCRRPAMSDGTSARRSSLIPQIAEVRVLVGDKKPRWDAARQQAPLLSPPPLPDRTRSTYITTYIPRPQPALIICIKMPMQMGTGQRSGGSPQAAMGSW